MAQQQQPSASVVWGRRAWTAVGIVLLLVALWYAGSIISIILTPVVLALFPAALLNPIASRLRASRLPNALGALLLLLLLLAVVAALVAFITAALADQLPAIISQVTSGLAQLEQTINWDAFPGQFEGIGDVAAQAASAVASGGLLGQGVNVITALVTGLVLMVVVLFFYLKDGRQIWDGFLEFVPRRHQQRVDLVAGQSYWTIGAYLRAQFLVAFVDAFFIGLGIWLLGVPLALPLAVLVFLGGLFPIIGAFFSGAVAVVVALASQGLGVAVAVLAIVLLVQQLESNILEPFIQGRVIHLHPLVIILAVTGGGILMGILGAFLAVPVAAVIARIIDNLRGRPFPVGPEPRGPTGNEHDAGEGAPSPA